MYKLPNGFDAVFFIGRILENVSFSENTVFFAFDHNVSVTVMSSLQHQLGPEDELATVQNIPLIESRLMQLLGRSVVRAAGDESGTLTLVFDHGHVLNIFDDQPCYESYSISDGQHETFV